VCEGGVQVLHNEVEVTKLGKGQVFGEMSILDPLAVASAKVVASKATHFLSIDRDTFLMLIKDSPEIALNMLRVLSCRLQETNNKLAGLTQQ
jgi:CRP/FNR family transcriptional regulator/CRP/FNR family cyclic AMP-dependent transcriptional regulator